MNVGIVIVSCLLAASVTGNENEWKEFDFDLEMSFETEDLNGPVDALSVVATTTVTVTESDVLRLLAAKSAPVPAPAPELISKLTSRIQSKNATLDNKRSKKPYSFEYAVEDSKSGLDYGHKESSDGEVVTGTYYVLLPDGRKETVNYKADVNGYVADVSYEGEVKKDNAQSQKPVGPFASSGISTQLQAYSNSPSIASTSTQSPQTSSSIFSVSTKEASLSSLPPASAALNKSADKAEIIVSTESVILSSSSPIVFATAPTTPSLLAPSTPNLLRSSTISLTTPIIPTSTNTPTSISAPIVTSASTLSSTSVSTSIPYSPTLNSTPATTPTTPTSTNTPTPISTSIVTYSFTTLSCTPTTPSSIQKPTLNSILSLTTPTTLTSTNTPITISAPIVTSGSTLSSTPSPTLNSTSISVSIVTSFTTLPSTSTTPSFIPKPTLNSTLSQVSVTASRLPSKSYQNSTSVPQFSLASKDKITSTPATHSPESSAILKIVSQTPGTPSSENESFFQALAGFIRSSGPIFIYCRSSLPTCSNSTRYSLASPCSNCKNLQKICSKLEFTAGQTYPIDEDKLEAFQAEIPAAPVWPSIKSSPATEVVLTFDSASSEEQRNVSITVATTTSLPFTRVPQPSSVPKNVSFKVPEGLADVVQSADTHFSYCQKIRPFCSRLESTRPYWEGSPETPSKQKEFLLSTIQACSYCRSLWPICSELESTGFLLDPSQLFTIHSLEEDVRSALFTIGYCRNVTQDCSEFLKSNRFTTQFPIPNKSFEALNGTYPVLLPTTSSPLVSADKPASGISGSSLPPQLPNSTLAESDAQREGGDGVPEEPKFINYCLRLTPICSQLLSI